MSREREIVSAELGLEIRKGQRYILEWPNGIGKTTLLKRLINAHDDDATIHEDVRVAYYSQDFNALDMSMEVWDSLHAVSNEVTDQEVYRVASMFLLKWALLKNTVGALSEWQKGLLCYARFVIQQPHLLILDEPTNHINFRHLPKIAEAINAYEGWIIMVSHDEAFVRDINELQKIDLGRLI
jgi:ATP-binding cassette subfamily F protein 3